LPLCAICFAATADHQSQQVAHGNGTCLLWMSYRRRAVGHSGDQKTCTTSPISR
jgi:hypothetical protein